MRFLLSLFVFSISGNVPAIQAEFLEKEIPVSEGVRGRLVTPAGTSPKKVVLLFHGWTGKMDEVGDMYKRMAYQLGDKGVASLRIDFRGEGARNGHRLTSTFATRIEDAEASLAKVQSTFPDAKVGVVGFSLGGATALALTGRHPSEIATLVLWSSSGNLGADFFGDVSRYKEQRKAIENGESKLVDWAEMTLTREHLMGFIGYDLLGPMKEYEGALLAIRGSDDFLTRYEDEFLAAASGWREEFIIIGGADHIFHTFNPESDHDERVIAATIQWIEETL